MVWKLSSTYNNTDRQTRLPYIVNKFYVSRPHRPLSPADPMACELIDVLAVRSNEPAAMPPLSLVLQLSSRSTVHSGQDSSREENHKS